MTARALRPWEAPQAGAFADRAGAFAALIPAFETPRLRLRAPRIEDFETYLTATNPSPKDGREDIWLDFCQMVASWLQRGFGPWTIESRDNETSVGFLPVDHEFGDPEPELGWFILPIHRRRGFAAEAARAALDRALPALGFRTIVSYIAANNTASLAVAASLGGQRLPDTVHPAPDVVTHRYDLPKVRP